jgi:hypothetical protein
MARGRSNWSLANGDPATSSPGTSRALIVCRSEASMGTAGSPGAPSPSMPRAFSLRQAQGRAMRAGGTCHCLVRRTVPGVRRLHRPRGERGGRRHPERGMAAADVSDMRLGSRGLSFDSEVPSFPPSVQGMATNDRPVLAASCRIRSATRLGARFVTLAWVKTTDRLRLERKHNREPVWFSGRVTRAQIASKCGGGSAIASPFSSSTLPRYGLSRRLEVRPREGLEQLRK